MRETWKADFYKFILKQKLYYCLSPDGEDYCFRGIRIRKEYVTFDSVVDIFCPHILNIDYSFEIANDYYSCFKEWIPTLRYLGDRFSDDPDKVIDWDKCRRGELIPLHGSFYLHNEVRVRPGDIVFDIGASPGDFTSLAIAEGAKNVYAFEPTSNGAYKLENLKSRMRPFPVIQKFVGSNDDREKNVVTLDTFCTENNIEKIDFLKVDIEGAERNLLVGSKKVLREHQPRISMCTYHKPDDIKILPELIKKFNPNYKIIQGRSVLYAYVPIQ